jgi:hypothetical protein
MGKEEYMQSIKRHRNKKYSNYQSEREEREEKKKELNYVK